MYKKQYKKRRQKDTDNKKNSKNYKFMKIL